MHRLILVATALALVGCPKKPTAPAPLRARRATPAEPRRTAPRPAARRARPAKPDPNLITLGGFKLEVSLQAERSSFMVGEPIYLTYSVHNHNVDYVALSEGYDTQNRLGRPNRYRVWARPVGSTTRLPTVDAGKEYEGRSWTRQISPDDAFKQELFLPNWVRFTSPGKYEISVSRRLQVHAVVQRYGKAPQKPPKVGKGVRVERRVVVTVTAATKEKLGKLIKELAEIVFSNDYTAKTKALKALAAIPDPRIVPHFLKVMKTFSSYYKYDVPMALSRFPTDAALSGLKLCVTDSNTTLRVRCAEALARSRHPKARGLLLGMRGDSYYPVRAVVVRELGKLGCAKAHVKLLKELSKDSSDKVSKPAKTALAACKGRTR